MLNSFKKSKKNNNENEDFTKILSVVAIFLWSVTLLFFLFYHKSQINAQKVSHLSLTLTRTLSPLSKTRENQVLPVKARSFSENSSISSRDFNTLNQNGSIQWFSSSSKVNSNVNFTEEEVQKLSKTFSKIMQ